MKRFLLITTAFFCLITLQSFTTSFDSNLIGTYGVSKNDPSKIQLVLSENNTFTYQDFSNPNKKINVSGTWTIKRNHVVLTATNSETAFHNKWKIDSTGKVATSRKGLTFYSLAKKCTH